MRVAIFGGTFDPIHNGHINLAIAAVEQLDIDRLIFMPNYISPFKLGQESAGADHRCEMIKRVLDLKKEFELSTYEVERKSPSYTFDTLEHFSEALEKSGENASELMFLMGEDSFLHLDTWYRGPDIIRKYHMITGSRPGASDAAFEEKLSEYREKYDAAVSVLDIEPIGISSSEIRAAISNGDNPEHVLPHAIIEYIKEHELYV